MFSNKIFKWIFWKEKWVDSLNIHLSFFWVCVKTHFLLVWIQEEAEIEFGVESKCALKEEGEKLKVKGTSQVV